MKNWIAHTLAISITICVAGALCIALERQHTRKTHTKHDITLWSGDKPVATWRTLEEPDRYPYTSLIRFKDEITQKVIAVGGNVVVEEIHEVEKR